MEILNSTIRSFKFRSFPLMTVLQIFCAVSHEEDFRKMKQNGEILKSFDLVLKKYGKWFLKV